VEKAEKKIRGGRAIALPSVFGEGRGLEGEKKRIVKEMWGTEGQLGFAQIYNQ